MITEELRNLAVYLDSAAVGKSEHGFSPVALRLNRIADHIEQKHDEELMQAKADVLADCISVANDFIELPKDADGVPIHIGDYLHSDENGKDFPCRGFELTLMQGVKWWTVECCYDSYSGTSEHVSAKSCHHVKPDSWEAIIEEAASYGDKRWFSGTQGDKAIIAELVERCKRLCEQERANEV